MTRFSSRNKRAELIISAPGYCSIYQKCRHAALTVFVGRKAANFRYKWREICCRERTFQYCRLFSLQMAFQHSRKAHVLGSHGPIDKFPSLKKCQKKLLKIIYRPVLLEFPKIRTKCPERHIIFSAPMKNREFPSIWRKHAIFLVQKKTLFSTRRICSQIFPLKNFSASTGFREREKEGGAIQFRVGFR